MVVYSPKKPSIKSSILPDVFENHQLECRQINDKNESLRFWLCETEMNICPSLCKSVLSLPMYGELTYGQQDEIAYAVKAYFNNHNVYKS